MHNFLVLCLGLSMYSLQVTFPDVDWIVSHHFWSFSTMIHCILWLKYCETPRAVIYKPTWVQAGVIK
ncbi:hypothetical protein [Vibrio phage RYC]|nr:hypothetical protein [Vibrio phage RYC]